MPNPVSFLRPAADRDAYELLEVSADASRAHIRFHGRFEGREVAWDAYLYALRRPNPVARRPFLDIAARGRETVAIRIGLDVDKLDAPTLHKAVIMVRRYRRLRRGRHEFGAPVHAIEKIISGGQAGVDRAALDAAAALGIPCGGWCPKSRRAEDGAIPARYPLTETASKDYRVRTQRNVRDSDGTLILAYGPLSGGSALTRRLAQKMNKPCLVVDLSQRPRAREVRSWLVSSLIRVLNVAGPRASRHPDLHAQARRFLRRVLAGP